MSVYATIDGYSVELDTDKAPACYVRRTVRFVDYAGELAAVRESCALCAERAAVPDLLDQAGAGLRIPPATVARILAWAAERGY